MSYTWTEFERIKVLLKDTTNMGVIKACLELSTVNGLQTIIDEGRGLVCEEETQDSFLLEKLLEKQSSSGIQSPDNVEKTCTIESPDRMEQGLNKESLIERKRTPPIKIKREPPSESESETDPSLKQKLPLKRKLLPTSQPTTKRKIIFSEANVKVETIDISSGEEESPNFWHTYEYPERDSVNVHSPTATNTQNPAETRAVKNDSIQNDLEITIGQVDSQKHIDEKSNIDTQIESEEESSGYRRVITQKLREAKLESMTDSSTSNQEYVSDSFVKDQFRNKTGLLVHAQPGKPTEYCRSCEICNKRYKDMKQHVITGHLTNNWWGSFGYSTCWNCQEFQYVGEIRNCSGEFNSTLHKEAFLFRFQCFESYIKEELDCKTDYEVVNIVRREGMCEKSFSNFPKNETSFLTLIDLSKDLIPKKLYDAGSPTRLSEIMHWRTIPRLISYNNDRGVISGDILFQNKIGLVETCCDLTKDYISSQEWGDVCKYTLLKKPCSTETSSVITEVNINIMSNYQNLIGDRLGEKEIKVSLGLNPKDSQNLNSLHIKSVEHNLANPKVVALGNVGLDPTIATPMSSQEMVLKTFLQMAKKTKKPIRVFSRGCHSQLMIILKDNLEDNQKIH